jgi:mannose-1-phosphate guanylyltransferase/mannose-6-phosphate isomerase
MDGTTSLRPAWPEQGETVAAGRNYRIKRLTVPPGAKLGGAPHRHRTKQFVILAGRARITRGTAIIDAAEDASVFIPVGMSHRLENPGRFPLSLLEIQVGSRFEDDDQGA